MGDFAERGDRGFDVGDYNDIKSICSDNKIKFININNNYNYITENNNELISKYVIINKMVLIQKNI